MTREFSKLELARASLSKMQELVCLMGPQAVRDAFTPEEWVVLKRAVSAWSTPLQRLPDPPGRPRPGYGWWKGQWPLPPGPWGEAILIGGRGAGKSTPASNWLLEKARNLPGEELGAVAPTKADLWNTCVENPHTGLLAWQRADFRFTKITKTALHLPNKAVIRLVSAEKPERLRSANNWAAAWFDELGACQRPEKAWENLRGSVRAGPRPQILLTMNPRKGLKLIRALQARRTACVVINCSLENPNLPLDFYDSFILPALGTPSERELVRGEQLDDDPSALFRRDWLKPITQEALAGVAWKRIGIGYDPAETSKSTADDTGIVAAGITTDDRCIVLADATANVPEGMAKPKPEETAMAAVRLYWEVGASFIIIDVVRNGETAMGLLRSAAKIYALEQKDSRLEAIRVIPRGGHKTKEDVAVPVANRLYAKGLVLHAPGLGALEDQLCEWTPECGWSPDRMDAACYVLSELALRPQFKQAGLNQGGATAPRRI